MTSTAAHPSIVFVSGAFHTDFHLRPVVPYFEKAGHRILALPLHCAGHPGTLEDEIAPIRSAVEAELQAGRDICMVLHSGAVFAGCETVNRLLTEGKIARETQLRVILLATIPDWSPMLNYVETNGIISWDWDNGQFVALQPYSFFYNDMEPQEAQPFVDAISYHSIYTPQISCEKWTEVPLISIICERDKTILPEFQREYARKYGMREIVVDCGHCPFISMPEKLVEVIDSALKS